MIGIAETALEKDIPYLTVWGCSVDNLTKRSHTEVNFLFRLFESYFKKFAKSEYLHKNEIKVNVLGRWEEFFPDKLKKAVHQLTEATNQYSRHQLTLLMAYSGIDEMRSAIEALISAERRDSNLKVTPAQIKNHLWTKDLPPVDLVIRTGGEPHWSAGLMMWDVAEAQLYFTNTLWPDFSPEEFGKALDYYSRTERRFGK